MALAALTDINRWLPVDQLQLTSGQADRYQIDVERLIKGMLANTYSPTTLAGWSDPSITNPALPGYVPELIRSIAGRFIASFAYRDRVSSSVGDIADYPQKLYDEAMGYLMGITTGNVVLNDVTEVVDTGSHLTALDFWPNDSTGPPLFNIEKGYFVN